MIKIENFEVVGWEHAIRGMRNPMNSWKKSDSGYGCDLYGNRIHCRNCNGEVELIDKQIKGEFKRICVCPKCKKRTRTRIGINQTKFQKTVW